MGTWSSPTGGAGWASSFILTRASLPHISMEQAVNLPDDLVESLISKTEDKESQVDDVASQTSSQSSKDSVDTILKWIEKKQLFISLERTEDAQQTEQALAVLPMKVCKRDRDHSFPAHFAFQFSSNSDVSILSRTSLAKVWHLKA